ncbi:hypothetical protein U1Q18_020844 [Sarracenia purpurea var. burkii]
MTEANSEANGVIYQRLSVVFVLIRVFSARDVGVDSSEAGRMVGVAMEFPTRDETTSSPTSPPRMPRRIRRRLLESKTSPSTVEEIEAKLRDADL